MSKTMTVILAFIGIGFIAIVGFMGGDYKKSSSSKENEKEQNSTLGLRQPSTPSIDNSQPSVLSEKDEELGNALKEPPAKLQPPVPGKTKIPPKPPATPSKTETDQQQSGPEYEEENSSYRIILKTTEGDITIKLKDQETAKAVSNFVKLSTKGFYDGTIFHRVIDGFMIQGGDPNGDGTGGPGYTFDDEPFSGEYIRGAVAMANSGPDTNGSQFFIMHEDYDLPKDYVIFGDVIDGMEVVDTIATAKTTVSATGEKSRPVNPVTINSVEVIKEEVL